MKDSYKIEDFRPPVPTLGTMTGWLGMEVQGVEVYHGYDALNLYTNVQIVTISEGNTNNTLNRFVVVLN